MNTHGATVNRGEIVSMYAGLNPPGCQWLSYISKVGQLHNWTSVLTMQCIPDQSHCQLNSVAQGGGHGHTAHWD